MWYSILVKSSISFFFFFSLHFVYVGMTWIVELSGLTLANKPLNDLHAHVGKMCDFQKFHVWRNARACIKCSSWIVKEDGQEKKRNIYKKMRCVALCGGKWKKRKIRRWGWSDWVEEKKDVLFMNCQRRWPGKEK